MTTWRQVYQWCAANPSLSTEGDGTGAGFAVHVNWRDGRAQNAMILRMTFGGIDCVAIRSMFMPVAQPEVFLAALQQVANTDLGQPFGMILSGGTILMSTALPLQDLSRSQFDFAVSQILSGGDSVEQVLGMDLNR